MTTLMGSISLIEQLGGHQTLNGKFSSIVSLNISDNPIEDVGQMIDEVVMLMPGVRDL